MKQKLFFFLFLILIHLTSVPAQAVNEPSLRELEQAALRYAGMEPTEIGRWKSRARWAALFPRVMVGYDQKVANQINTTIQDSISVSSSGITLGPPESKLYQDNNLNRGFEVKATWALDELVFNKDSLDISAEARYRHVVRSQIIDELHMAYFERKRLLVKTSPLLLPALSQLKLEELEAKLDSLTGGYFSKMKEGDQK